MGIEWLRDLVIVILGIVAIVALICITVLAFLFYRRVNSITGPLKTTAQRIEGISAQAETIKPIIQVAYMIQGICQGIDAVKKTFKKKQGGEHE